MEKLMNTLFYYLTEGQKQQINSIIIDTIKNNTISKSYNFNKETLSIIEHLIKEELGNDYFSPELKQTREVRLLMLNKNLELYKNKYLDISSKKV